MPDNKEHNEPLDRFSAQVKCKLDNHRLPVDADCWKEIEAQVNARPRKTLWQTGAWAAAVAAVVGVAVLFLLPSPLPKTDKLLIEHLAPPPEAEPQKDSLPPPSVYTADSPARPQFVQVQNMLIPDTIVPEEDDIVLTAVELPAVQKRHQTGPEPEYRPATIRRASLSPKSRHSGKWLLAANVGTGGHMPSLLESDFAVDPPQNDMAPGGPDIGFPEPPSYSDLHTILSPGSFSDINYAPPLSFGFTVRKNLSKHVGIETGLVYTYLLSKMHQNGQISYRSKLNLHYLGIPVHVVFYLWNNPKWTLYASAGGMVEKGLRSVYTQEARMWDKSVITAVRSNINGLQGSLNISAGVSYKFYPNWGLYLEPRYSYYFDMDQPISIRTDKPAVVGINAGLRYEF